jgi:hypothetical protein
MDAARKLEPVPQSDPMRRAPVHAELDRLRREDDGSDPFWTNVLASPIAVDLADEESEERVIADIVAGRGQTVARVDIPALLQEMREEQGEDPDDDAVAAAAERIRARHGW